MKICNISKALKQLVFTLCVLLSGTHYSQNFSQSNLNFNGVGSVNQATSLMFGPDGRLYVAEYPGLIKVLTVERAGNSNYVVTAMETLNHVQIIQNHNDDGTLDNTPHRQLTGRTVVGTAQNPVIYATSSDFRIGGGVGGGGGDIGVDTNSGVITRITWNGSSWDAVDIVRGISRSEENHAISGVEFVTVNGIDYLIVTSGGHTNGGAPGTNFIYLTEYALAAALLSVNLSQLESMPIQIDVHGRNYIYDLPTLDDPERANINGITDPDTPGYDGIDINDPFGGNDGLNQAKIVPGGPVQIFSPGYRNTYDLVVTESGKVLATDNGANGGWGGFPMNEGLLDSEGNSLVTNDYDPLEPGSSTPSGGEQINNIDHLQLITNDINNYNFGSYYGGHPTPIRANPSGAGLYTAPAKFDTTGAVFRTQKYDPDGSTPGSTTNPNIGLPVDWPPVPIDQANPVEGDWRAPGGNNPDGDNDNALLIWETNTNGIDEYTASNFGGIMKGDLIAGTNQGQLRRVHFNTNGSVQFTSNFVSGLSGDGLGVTCNGDSDIFPGTIWVGDFANAIIYILEPQDFIICLNPGDEGYDANADYDDDGYTNQDELDNLTDPCNGGSQPQDFDKSSGGTLISDLNDTDDDNDGIPDALDPFQLGNPNETGSDAFIVPVINELFSSTSLGGYRGLGMTGMMNNGDTGANWLNWLDRRGDPTDPNPNDVLGGAIGAMTMQMTAGTALGVTNTQEKGFQYGVQVDQNTGQFKVTGAIANFNQPLQLYGNTSAPNGELGIFIGDGTQSNYIKFVANKTGLRVQQEINDSPQPIIELPIANNSRPHSSIRFSFIVNPVTGEITCEYEFDNGIPQTMGSLTAQGSILTAIQQSTTDLAVGFIGTSNATGVELEGTWDILNVTKVILNPILTDAISNQTNEVGDVLDGNLIVNATGGDGALNFVAQGLPPGLTIDPNTGIFSGTVAFGSASASPYNVTVTISDSDGDGDDNLELTFTWVITDPSLPTNTVVVARVNAGGGALTANDNGTNWLANTVSGAFSNPTFTVNTGNTYTSGANITRGASIPNYIDTTTFNGLFANERWDEGAAPEMQFDFPLPNAQYLVNLYMANASDGTNDPGERVFDIAIEGNLIVSGLDLVAEFGHQVGGMISFPVTVSDGTLNIQFLHDIENPLVNAIEIREIIDESEIVTGSIADQTNLVGDALDGSLGLSASGGIGNRTFSATNLPPGIFIDPTNGQIGGLISEGAEINSPYNVTVTVDDSDGSPDNAVTVEFTWTINVPVNSIAALRVNAGGGSFTATDEGTNWLANTASGSFSNSSYSVNTGNSYTSGTTMTRHASIPDYIDTPTFNALFANERWDEGAAPEMQFNFPLANGEYLVNLYMANATDGTNDPGERVFNIAMEGSVVKSGMDIVAEFGHQAGGMLSFPVTVSDGTLNVQFIHVTENPLVNAIEVRMILDNSEIVADAIANQTNTIGDVLDGNLVASATGGIGDLTFNAAGLPQGITINTNTGFISGTVAETAGANSPYNVTVTVDDSDGSPDNAVTVEFTWTINVPVNSIAALRVNAGGGSFTATDEGTNWLANTASGSFSNSSYSVNTGNSYTSGTTMTRHASIPDYIDTPTFNALFANERWDEGAAPEMQFNFPLANGEYLVNLYMANATDGTNDPGERVFNIAMEGSVVKSGMDIVAEFGHQAGGMLSFPVTVSDGTLNVQFIHVTENPLVNAIEVRMILDNSEIVADAIANQTNTIGDVLDGNLVASATGGIGDLTFNAAGLPQGITINTNTGFISGTVAETAGANSPYNVTVTVDDSDGSPDNAVTVEFTWTINVPVNSIAALRVNAGGGSFTATDEGTNWLANTASGSFSNSSYSVNTGNSYTSGTTMTRHASIPDYIDTPTFNALFANERWDEGAAPEMQFNFPLANGEYLVNLYMANATDGTNDPGERVFNIAMEGSVVKSGMDIVAEFGHQAGGMLSFPVTVSDGTLNVQFIHVTENPLVNAIEVRMILDNSEIVADAIANQTNTIGDVLDGNLVASATGGIGDLTFNAAGLPQGITINTNTGFISGTVAETAGANSPYNVTVTVDDSDGSPDNAVTVEFTWTINVPVNSIAALRVNAGGGSFTATDEGTNWLANTASGSFSNSSYSVNTGNSYTSGTTMTRHASIPDYIDTPTFNALFANERWDEGAAPEMQFNFPLANGEYLVNLYMANATDGTNDPGERVFNIAMEGSVVKSGMDIVAEFGHQAGGMLSFPVTVSDGTLNVQFIHVTENPLVNAIEVRTIISDNSGKISDSKVTDNTLSVNKSNSDLAYKDGMVIYPNPTSSETQIKLSDNNLELSNIYLYDISGRLIKTFDVSKSKQTKGLYKIDVSELQNGTYFINLRTYDGFNILGKRLIIQK